MKKVFALVDYKGFFGSHYEPKHYRSGMDRQRLSGLFTAHGIDLVFMNFQEVDFGQDNSNKIFIYTSQEDRGLYYKNYIEDVIYGLEMQGATVIPSYRYLKANNNKVFMEILREIMMGGKISQLNSFSLGSLEDLKKIEKHLSFPVVVKGSGGSMGKKVFLATDKAEMYRIVKEISRTASPSDVFKEIIRRIRHKGYTPESFNRSKFIIQDFIPGLVNDWKVYVYGSRYYIFYRPVLKNRGIRASGGGYNNYYFGKNAKAPHGILDFAKKIFKLLDVPSASLDICFDGTDFYLLEYQCLYFGTAGILKKYSKEYFEYDEKGGWIDRENEGDIELVYSNSIIEYLNNNKL